MGIGKPSSILAVASRAASSFSRPTFYSILHPFYFLRHHAFALKFHYVSWLLHFPIGDTRTNSMLMTSCCRRTRSLPQRLHKPRTISQAVEISWRRSFTVRMYVILRYCVARSKSYREPGRRGCDSTQARLSLLPGASQTLMAARKRKVLINARWYILAFRPSKDKAFLSIGLQTLKIP